MIGSLYEYYVGQHPLSEVYLFDVYVFLGVGSTPIFKWWVVISTVLLWHFTLVAMVQIKLRMFWIVAQYT